MEKLIVLGTGHAMVTRCYNTCFVLDDGEGLILVDGGGGNTLLARFQQASLDWHRLHHLIVTHAHIDHLLGVIWAIRRVATGILHGRYMGNLQIYGHGEVLDTIETICRLTLRPVENQLFGNRLILLPVADGEEQTLLRYPVTFFDLGSEKSRQFGFTLRLHNGRRLTCLGDEPYHPASQPYAQNADWLLCEAFCLDEMNEKYRPNEIHHATVRQACTAARDLQASRIVLWHTEDDHLDRRKELYTAEGQLYFPGEIYVPDDLEVIPL